jgi:hypothetical protein
MTWYIRDAIPSVIVALVIAWAINAMLQEQKPECPPMYKMKVEMTKNSNVLVCKYKP